MGRTALFSQKQSGGVYTVTDMQVNPGNVWFVGNAVTGASDTVGWGTNPDYPFATIDYAIGQCTASYGDVIYVLPGHVESLSDTALITLDVIGVSVIGLGKGALRPAVHYDNAASVITMTAASCSISNLQLLPSVTDITKGVNIAAADCAVTDCVFLPGETAPTATDEFTAAVIITSAGTRAHVERNEFYTILGDAAAYGVKLVGAVDSVVVRDNIFAGAGGYTSGAIATTSAAAINVTITDNIAADVKLYAKTTGIVQRNGYQGTEFTTFLQGKQVGNVYFVDGGSTGLAAGHAGTSPNTACLTLTAALAKCTDGNNDFIFVLNYGSAGRTAETWPIVVSKSMVHIIGTTGKPSGMWATVTATGENKDAFNIATAGGHCEIAWLEIGGTAAGSGSGINVGITPAGAPWGLHVHDCWFGVADGAGANGIYVPSGCDAPQMAIERCRFGDALTGTGIKISGVCTRGTITDNVFTRTPVGILLSGTSVFVARNYIAMGSDAAGKGMNVATTAAKCYITDNQGTFGDAAATNCPFLENNSTDVNDWGLNYQDITACLST